MAQEPEQFMEQLPFYSVKPLYPLLMFLLNQVGIDLVLASILISRAAYLLIGILLWRWLSKYYPPFGSFVFASLFMSMPFILSLSGESTPDALSSSIVLLAFFLFIETSRTNAAYALLVFSIAARPDNVILVTLVAIYDLVFRKENRRLALGIVVTALALYGLQTKLSGNYGWTTLFYHSQISILTSPASASASFSIFDYIKVLARNSHPLKLAGSSYSLLLFVLLSILTLRLQSTERVIDTKKFQLLFVSLLYVGAHWLIFPHQKERILAGWFLFVLVMLTTTVQERLHPSMRRPAPS